MKNEISYLKGIINAVIFLVMVTFAGAGLSGQMGLDEISFEDIGAKLELSEEQVTQLKAIQTAHSEKVSSLKSKINQADDRKSRKALVNDMRKQMKTAMAEVQEVLTSAQFEAFQAHLGELRATKQKEMQNDGMADMQERLGLSAEQVAEIQPLMAVYQPQIGALMTELNGAEGLRQKRKAASKAKELRSELDEEIKVILTGAQYSEWEAMGEERRAKMRETMRND